MSEYKIFSPLVWGENESKQEILKKLLQMDSDEIISAIEVNIPGFFEVFDPEDKETINIIEKLKKPLLGMCGLESKGDLMSQDEKIAYLIKAFKSGFEHVEIEYTKNFEEYSKKAIKELKEKCKSFSTDKNLTIEYASFEATPSFEDSCKIIDAMLSKKPFLIKFVTMVKDPKENQIFYKLLEKYKGNNLVAFGMGEIGKESRIRSVTKGGYATYGHFGDASKACPGQFYYKDLLEEIKKADKE